MICERCGSTIPEGQKFCGQCGAPAPSPDRLAAVPSPSPVAALQPAAAPQPVAASGSRFNLRTCLLVGAGCLVVLVIGACLVAAFFLPIGRAAFENVRDQFSWTDVQQFGTAIIQALPEATIPVELASATPEPAPDFCAGQLCLQYPNSLGFTAQATTQPEQLEPDVWAEPQHLELTFPGYPLMNTRHVPHLNMYDTARFRDVNPNVGSLLDQLQDLLQSHPVAPDTVPLISLFNAAQMLTADVAYLDFDGGTGVRFVTQYGQAVWPINNYDLFYAFTGLSEDGSRLIVAVMPIANLALPDDPENVIAGDMESFAEGFQDYIVQTEAMLNAAAPGSFTPDLDLLDGLMRSIQLMP